MRRFWDLNGPAWTIFVKCITLLVMMIKPNLKDSQCVFRGVKFDVCSGKLPTREGKHVQKDVIIHPGAVVVLPLLDKNRVVLIRNYRFAVDETLWELPAGTLEPEEPPEKAAARELIEETGYQAKKVEAFLTFFPSPGICNEKMFCFLATDLSHVGQNLEASEQITVETLSWKKILQMISSGEIHDAKTIVTLLYYHTFHR